ncbi:MAG: hypothetical protein P8M53_08275, partial [Pirellulales bacterium]|nr:hypothetical protein [Pirellulales bacterium]
RDGPLHRGKATGRVKRLFGVGKVPRMQYERMRERRLWQCQNVNIRTHGLESVGAMMPGDRAS